MNSNPIAFLCLSFTKFTVYPDARVYFWNSELACRVITFEILGFGELFHRSNSEEPY